MVGLAVDWSRVASGLLDAERARRPVPEGDYHYPDVTLRAADSEPDFGVLLQGVRVLVLPQPSRLIFCGGVPYIEYGLRPDATVRWDQLIAPTAVTSALVRRYSDVSDIGPDLLLTCVRVGANNDFSPYLRLRLRRPLFVQVGERVEYQGMTVMAATQLAVGSVLVDD